MQERSLVFFTRMSTKRPEITKREVQFAHHPTQKLIFILDNVFTPEECQDYIDKTEKMGYIKAKVNIGGQSVRCCFFLNFDQRAQEVSQGAGDELKPWKVRHTSVDEAHCCDTSRSLRILIGWHSKATSNEQGCKPLLVKQLLYRLDISIQHPTELASLACTLRYSWDTY